MFKKRLKSFRFALDGLKHLFTTQPNAKIHLAVALIVTIAGWFFSLSLTEWALITFAIALVITTEAINTALESLTDLVSPNYHKLAGTAKDVAAAGVLVAAIGAAIIGFLIFLPKLLLWFGL